jgi:predicted aspartyl protease
MRNDMGVSRVDVEIENPAHLGEKRALRSVLVDTGAELSWVPKKVLESLGVERNRKWYFRQADGTVLERWTGIVVIGVAGKRTGDDVVFGEPGDLVPLGSRTLEGLNVRVDPVITSGPVHGSLTLDVVATGWNDTSRTDLGRHVRIRTLSTLV